MKTVRGDEMYLTPDAEIVATDLAALGATFESGHRDVYHQAHAMAVNSMENRQWIGETYKHGAGCQALLNKHPEWDTKDEIEKGLLEYMLANPDEAELLSHHFQMPSPVFDVTPATVTVTVKARIQSWQQDGTIRQVLWKEGGLNRCHVEVADLPHIKHSSEV